MIGLYDMDLYKNASIPNLELMKIANYYRQEENQMCRLILPGEFDYDGYDKIYVFSENIRHNPVTMSLRRTGKIITGGSGFTNGEYIPLQNPSFDNYLPTIQPYKEYLSNRLKKGEMTPLEINRFLDTTYYRMQAAGRPLPLQKTYNFKKIILYDREFLFDGWKNVYDKLLATNPTSITTLHPVFCNSLEEYQTVKECPRFSKENKVVLNVHIPYSSFYSFFKKNGQMFNNNVGYLPVGGDLITNVQYFDDFIYKMNLLFGFWGSNIPMHLLYVDSKDGKFNPIKELSELCVKWAALDTSNRQSQDFSEQFRLANNSDKPTIKRQIEMLKNYYPPVVNFFDKSYSQLSYWRPV